MRRRLRVSATRSGTWPTQQTQPAASRSTDTPSGIFKAKDAPSTTTAKKDVYAFYFDQKGLMGGVSIQGTKVTHLDK